MKKLFYFCGIILLVNCKTNESNLYDENMYQVISYIINTDVKRIPPPPPLFDSVKKTPLIETNDTLKVGIYPTLDAISSIEDRKFLILNDKIDRAQFTAPKKHYVINKSKISNSKNIKLFYSDTIKLNHKDSGIRQSYYLDFNSLIRFSRIEFNSEFTRALVTFSQGWSELTGGTNLYYLEKENNKWKIVSSLNLEMS